MVSIHSDRRRPANSSVVGCGKRRCRMRGSWGSGNCVRDRRRTLAADDRRGLVNEIVVFEGLHHEQGEVHAARDVALEDGVADVAAPHRQALAVALLEVAATHDGPAGIAGEDALGRLHLVVEVGEASQAREWSEDLHDRLELPRIDVLTIAGDVPTAREHQPCPGLRVVEDRLRRSRRVAVYSPRDEHDEHPVAARDSPLDDLAVVGCAGHDGDPPLELGELADALLAAHGNYLVLPVQRVLDQVPPKLPGRTDDADPHASLPSWVLRWPPQPNEARRAAFETTRGGTASRGPAARPFPTIGASQYKPGAGYRFEAQGAVSISCRGTTAARRNEQSRMRASPFRGDSLVSGYGRGGRAGSLCRGCGARCRMVWAARVCQRVGASV